MSQRRVCDQCGKRAPHYPAIGDAVWLTVSYEHGHYGFHPDCDTFCSVQCVIAYFQRLLHAAPPQPEKPS